MYMGNEPAIDELQTPQAQLVHNEVILISNDNSITVADRSILARHSEWFRSKFNDPATDEVAIKVDCVNGATLEVLLDFYYSRTIDITASNVEIIFMAANNLRFTEILHGCAELFMANLNEHSVWNCMKIGEAFNIQKMLHTTHQFIVQNFLQIVHHHTDEFVQLEARHLQAFLEDDKLCVDDEMDAFQAMTTWLQHSYTERLPFISRLMSKIRLSQLNIDFLMRIAALLAREANCLPMVEEAINWARADPTRRIQQIQHDELPFNPQPRFSTIDMNFHFVNSGGNGDGSSKRFIELYKPAKAAKRPRMATMGAV